MLFTDLRFEVKDYAEEVTFDVCEGERPNIYSKVVFPTVVNY